MRSAVSEALGSLFEPSFMERWFNGWVLAASVGTAEGIWVGRKFGGQGDWDNWEFEGDMGSRQKMS